MKVVVQRVSEASVSIDSRIHSSIDRGLVLLLGIDMTDSEKSIDVMVQKILKLRIFNDENNKMNKSLLDIDGSLLIISQFTLLADCSRGNRPSYSAAARPEIAIPLYEYFLKQCKANVDADKVCSGIFGTDMKINLINDGPVTIVLG